MKERTSQEKYPPIWVWSVATVIAAFWVTTLLWKIQGVEYEFAEFDEYNEGRVNALLAANVDLRVIVAGDSRIRYSIDPALFQKEVEKQLGLRASIVMITANRGTWNNIDRPLTPLLNEASLQSEAWPVVLLIDDNMFAKEWTWQHDFRHRRDFAIWSILGDGVWRYDGGRDIQEATQSETRCEGLLLTEETPEARVLRVSDYFRMNPDGENAQKVEKFAEAVSEKGGLVATLYVPPRPGGEPIVWQRPFDALTLNVGFHPDPRLYCDPVHLNSRGRQMFTKSFARSFTQRLRK